MIRDMSLTRDEAWKQVCAWTKGASLRRHARAVELVMRAAAHRYGRGEEEVERWGLAGLLHDADYERWPERHPAEVVGWLRELGETELAHAIAGHYTKWGVSHDSQLDRALVACDELTGFVMACCLVRPEGVRTIKPKSVTKKLKDKSFAAKVERAEVHAGIAMLEVELGEHVQFVIDALRPHGDELGISGG